MNQTLIPFRGTTKHENRFSFSPPVPLPLIPSPAVKGDGLGGTTFLSLSLIVFPCLFHQSPGAQPTLTRVFLKLPCIKCLTK